MDTASAQHQYVTGQMRESFGPLLAGFDELNAKTVAEGGWTLDLTYGFHPRERLDLRAATVPRGTLLYLHAGYWQSRDKAQFRFLAPGFNALGWDLALANYPLCPEVSVAQIVDSAARALNHLGRHQAAQGRMGPLVLCGHSAGAHLAVELALRLADCTLHSELKVVGVVAISGVFDLRPLVQTTLNDKLQLDATQALACSPCTRARPGAVPAFFVVGETETPAFHAQSQDMARQWQTHGNTAQLNVAPGADHFSVLQHLAKPQGPVAQALHTWTAAPP